MKDHFTVTRLGQQTQQKIAALNVREMSFNSSRNATYFYRQLNGKKGRVPFDQNFRFEFLKFSYVEWNGIFHKAGPISFFSRLSTFPTKNYSTKC